jgi:hypothetical protein
MSKIPKLLKLRALAAAYMALWNLLVSVAILPTPATAALPNNTIVWEVRPTVGADTNGCGYVAGTTATTTDYSQNNNKNAAACSNCGSSTQDLSTTDAVAVGTTSITSATANFVAVKGNLVKFSGGTGAIAAVRRQVVSVTNTTTIVLDAAIAASVGMTMNIGGACAGFFTTGGVFTENTKGNKFFTKDTGTLTLTATQSLNQLLSPTATQPMNRIIGYTTTRGDNGRFHITLSGAGLTAFARTGGSETGWSFENIDINCASQTTSMGLNPDDSSQIINVKISNCTNQAVLFNNATSVLIADSEITGCTSGCTNGAVQISGRGMALRNWIHDNVSIGLKVGSGTLLFNLITNNTGATSDGIQGLGPPGNAFFNTVYGSGRHGINQNSNSLTNQVSARNNLLVNNAGFGFVGGNVAGSPALPAYDGNAYFNNTSGTRSNADDTGTVNAIDGIAPYTNTLDVTSLTCDPFVNAAGNNFTLNSAACGGALVRYAGTPGPIPGNSSTGHQTQGSSAPGAVTKSSASAQ